MSGRQELASERVGDACLTVRWYPTDHLRGIHS